MPEEWGLVHSTWVQQAVRIDQGSEAKGSVMNRDRDLESQRVVDFTRLAGEVPNGHSCGRAGVRVP